MKFAVDGGVEPFSSFLYFTATLMQHVAVHLTGKATVQKVVLSAVLLCMQIDIDTWLLHHWPASMLYLWFVLVPV